MSDSIAQEEQQTGVVESDDSGQNEEGAVSLGDNYNPEKAGQSAQEVNDGAGQNPSERFAQGSPAIDPADYKINYGEGANVQPYIDKQFRDFARENGVSGEMAQKLVDFNNQLEVARIQDQKLQAGKWREETKSLPGWQGASYNQNMAIANNALQAFASPQLVNLIVESGYQNHPEVIKVFHGIGVRMSEDTYVDNKGPAVRKKTMGEILYPNQPI